MVFELSRYFYFFLIKPKEVNEKTTTYFEKRYFDDADWEGFRILEFEVERLKLLLNNLRKHFEHQTKFLLELHNEEKLELKDVSKISKNYNVYLDSLKNIHDQEIRNLTKIESKTLAYFEKIIDEAKFSNRDTLAKIDEIERCSVCNHIIKVHSYSKPISLSSSTHLRDIPMPEKIKIDKVAMGSSTYNPLRNSKSLNLQISKILENTQTDSDLDKSFEKTINKNSKSILESKANIENDAIAIFKIENNDISKISNRIFKNIDFMKKNNQITNKFVIRKHNSSFYVEKKTGKHFQEKNSRTKSHHQNFRRRQIADTLFDFAQYQKNESISSNIDEDSKGTKNNNQIQENSKIKGLRKLQLLLNNISSNKVKESIDTINNTIIKNSPIIEKCIDIDNKFSQPEEIKSTINPKSKLNKNFLDFLNKVSREYVTSDPDCSNIFKTKVINEINLQIQDQNNQEKNEISKNILDELSQQKDIDNNNKKSLQKTEIVKSSKIVDSQTKQYKSYNYKESESRDPPSLINENLNISNSQIAHFSRQGSRFKDILNEPVNKNICTLSTIATTLKHNERIDTDHSPILNKELNQKSEKSIPKYNLQATDIKQKSPPSQNNSFKSYAQNMNDEKITKMLFSQKERTKANRILHIKGNKEKINFTKDNSEYSIYVAKIINQNPWMNHEFLRKFDLDTLMKNYPIKKDFDIHILDQIELQKEIDFIKKNVEPLLSKAKTMKTDYELAFDVRYYCLHGDYLIKRFQAKNFYQRLDLNKNCSDSDIKTAFRAKALQWHPDNIKIYFNFLIRKNFKICFANENYYIKFD